MNFPCPIDWLGKLIDQWAGQNKVGKEFMLLERVTKAGRFFHALPQKKVETSTLPSNGPPLYFK